MPGRCRLQAWRTSCRRLISEPDDSPVRPSAHGAGEISDRLAENRYPRSIAPAVWCDTQRLPEITARRILVAGEMAIITSNVCAL